MAALAELVLAVAADMAVEEVADHAAVVAYPLEAAVVAAVVEPVLVA